MILSLFIPWIYRINFAYVISDIILSASHPLTPPHPPILCLAHISVYFTINIIRLLASAHQFRPISQSTNQFPQNRWLCENYLFIALDKNPTQIFAFYTKQRIKMNNV